jgi:hypothetical protein
MGVDGPHHLSILTVHRVDMAGGALIVHFSTHADVMSGNPLQCGVSLTGGEPAVNLQLAGNIRRIIEQALWQGWTGCVPMRIRDGLQVFLE